MECTFLNSSVTAKYSESDNNWSSVTIASSLFSNNDHGLRAVLSLSNGDVSITNCTFLNNSTTFVGGGVRLSLSTGNVSIASCTIQDNSATYFANGGGAWLSLSIGNVSITNCTFHDSIEIDGHGGGVSLIVSAGDVSITTAHYMTTMPLMLV